MISETQVERGRLYLLMRHPTLRLFGNFFSLGHEECQGDRKALGAGAIWRFLSAFAF